MFKEAKDELFAKFSFCIVVVHLQYLIKRLLIKDIAEIDYSISMYKFQPLSVMPLQYYAKGCKHDYVARVDGAVCENSLSIIENGLMWQGIRGLEQRQKEGAKFEGKVERRQPAVTYTDVSYREIWIVLPTEKPQQL